MALSVITQQQRQRVIEDINLDETQMRQKTEKVKDWMKKQPHLPHVPDKIAEKMIRAFLVGTKMSTETVKYKIDTYYAMRHQLPEIFLDRDPTKRDIRDSVEVIFYFPVSELTPEGIRINIIALNREQGFTTKDMKAFFKRSLAIGDIRMQSDEFCTGEYIVVDCRGFHLSHVTEIPWLFAQKFSALCQEGMPIRIKGVFVINAPKYTETVLNILKPAFKEKVKRRIQLFQGDHTNLYKFIPQRILPSDYGGEGPSIEESNRSWQKTIESMQDFLIEDEKRKTDEYKRPRDSSNDYGQMFGINGTFNKLNID